MSPGQVAGDLRVRHGRPERGGEVFPQRRRRRSLAGLLQRLPYQGINEPPPGLRQFPDLRPVERGLGSAQLIAEPVQLAGHPGVGADQLVDDPGRAGGLAQAGDLPGRGAVTRGPGRGGQRGAALGEPLRVRAVQLGAGLTHEIGTAHPVIVPRAAAPHDCQRGPPRAARAALPDEAEKTTRGRSNQAGVMTTFRAELAAAFLNTSYASSI